MRTAQIKFILLSAVLLSCFFSCQNDVAEIMKITGTKAKLPAMTCKDVDLDYRDSGRIVLKMQAKQIRQYAQNAVPEPYYEADKGLKVTFYDKEGKQVSTLSSQYGIYYEHTQRVEVRHKVVVVNKDGQRLESEKLTWKQNDSIRSEGQVIMWEKNRKLVGKNLVANEDFSHMELTDISAILPIDEEKKP
jgi:LPS export ABC transporter protein LptC